MNIIAYVQDIKSLDQVIYEAEHCIKRLERDVTLYLIGYRYSKETLPVISELTIITSTVDDFNNRSDLGDLINKCDRVYIDSFVDDSKYSEYMQVLEMIEWSTVPITLLQTAFNDYNAQQYKDDAYFYVYDSNLTQQLALGFTHLTEILSNKSVAKVRRVYLLAHDNSFQLGDNESLYSLISKEPKLVRNLPTRYIVEVDKSGELSLELSAQEVIEYADDNGFIDKNGLTISGDVTIFSIIEEIPLAAIHKHILDRRASERYSRK